MTDLHIDTIRDRDDALAAANARIAELERERDAIRDQNASMTVAMRAAFDEIEQPGGEAAAYAILKTALKRLTGGPHAE